MAAADGQAQDDPADGPEWWYLDRSGREFGPFRQAKMRAWFSAGFFPIGEDLLVRLKEWSQHLPVKQLYPEGEKFAAEPAGPQLAGQTLAAAPPAYAAPPPPPAGVLPPPAPGCGAGQAYPGYGGPGPPHPPHPGAPHYGGPPPGQAPQGYGYGYPPPGAYGFPPPGAYGYPLPGGYMPGMPPHGMPPPHGYMPPPDHYGYSPPPLEDRRGGGGRSRSPRRGDRGGPRGRKRSPDGDGGRRFKPHHTSGVPKTTDLSSKFGNTGAPPTTAMLRNIPNKYSQEQLLEEIGSQGFENKFDFFYLPIDVRNNANVGYAFINFLETESFQQFCDKFKEYHFQRSGSKKVAAVCPAIVQGLKQNIENLMKKRVTQGQYGPILMRDGKRIELEEMARLVGASS